MSRADVRTLARPDAWAAKLKLRVDGRPFSLEGREYVHQVIRDTSETVIVKKAAQTAFTVTFLVRTFHWIVERGWHHLYLLPLKTGAIPFVQSRIDPIIDSNEYVKTHFKSVDNRLHKQTTDDIKLLIRGTNVESELQETPVDVVVFDEYDRMVQDFLEDAKHRRDGSLVKKLAYLSTPTVNGHGIDADNMWWASDQHKWEIKCPGCGRFQFLSFDENLRLGDTKDDCVLECSHCSREFKDGERHLLNKTGRWSPYNLEGKTRGYQINQFCSPTMTLADVMESYYDGQMDAKKLKSFYNQSLGEPYTSPGDKVTIELLDSCREAGFQSGGIPLGAVYIGVDVGHDVLHVEGDFIDRFGKRRLWQIKRITDRPGDNAFRQLDRWLDGLGSFVCVIDAHPDKREAAELSKKYPGKVFIGFEMDRPQTETMADFQKVVYREPTKVTIDRTMAFDSVISQMLDGNYILPWDARELGEIMPRRDYNGFYHQMTQQVRVEEEDTKSRIVASWKKNKNPDHWHHASMFAYIATLRKPQLRVSAGIQKAFHDAGSMVGA